MRLLGLTGGIATGKSTVSRMLADMGAIIIDADQLAREVVEPGKPALEEIGRRFPGVVDHHGRLDRKALAERIFKDATERNALNAIIHPRIQEAFRHKVASLEKQKLSWAVYDVPLLFENGLQGQVDAIAVVFVPPDIQLERLQKRDGLSRQEAERRIQSQWPIEQKSALATWVVDNSQSLEHTRKQVEQIYLSFSGHPSIES